MYRPLAGVAAAEVGHTGGVIPVLRASAVSAVLAGVLAAGGCSSGSSSGCPPGASCPETAPFRVTFATTVNGRFAPLPSDGIPPRYSVRAGQALVISVEVTVPGRATVSALWLGIATGTVGFGPKGPIGVHPILAHSRQVLPAGSHSFRLRWRTPAQARPGTRLYLVADWASRQTPTFGDGQVIADFVPS